MSEIKGKPRTEADYRATLLDSSSSLKDFSLDRKKYYRKYILKEEIKEKDNAASNMGRLVETLLMEPELFDDKFYMSSCIESPTGLMLEFVNHLCNLTIESIVDGEITKDFEELSKEAYKLARYKLSYEAVIKSFTSPSKSGDIPEHYYQELLKVTLNNLTVVTTQDVTNAENIVSELKNNFVTSGIFNLVESDRWEILNQLQIEGYYVQGHKFKSMLDRVVVDHKNKIIQPYDLKCTWSVENFYEEYYLYRRSYIQAYLYYHACLSLTKDENSKYYGYSVDYLKFIVCDSINYMNPLIYVMLEKNMKDAEEGFIHKGRTYPGVSSIIDDLNWAIEQNIWNISRDNFNTNGITTLK